MAESDVATAPPEISPADTQAQAQESTPPPSDVAAAAGKVSEEVEEVEEVKEVEETEVGKGEGEGAGADEEVEEVAQENQDLKRKLEEVLEEVQEETERQAEGAGNGEDGEGGGEEREGNDAKRQRTETTAEAERSGEGKQEEPTGAENAENAENVENAEHESNNNGEQAAEGDVQKDDFAAEKAETETEDGSSETTRMIEVPNHRVGVLIGKAGDTIRNMQKLSGAKIQIVKDSDTAPDATIRMVELLGSVESIEKAEQLIKDVLAEADAGRPPPLYGRGFNSSQSGATEIEMQVPNDKVGSIIGKGGQMIKDLQARSGAHILLVPTESSEEEDVKERTVRLTGNKQQVEAAKYMIKDVINQTGRSYPPNRGGSGPRQSYNSRGPGSYGPGSQKQWGQPRQHHQSHSPGYNKYPNQRGGKNYPQQFPQNPRQGYGKYPPGRTGGRGGGGTGPSWDQRAPYQQPSQYGTSGGGPQYGQQQHTSHGYGAPNLYQQNMPPPQQSYQTPPPPQQQYYGQQATQPNYQQQPYNMYPQGQVAGGTYAAPAGTPQAQNVYAMGQYGQQQGYTQPSATDAYSQQQYAQQYPQQPGGYSQVAAAAAAAAAPAYNNNVNYGYQTGVGTDPSSIGQGSYGQVMPVTQAGYGQEQQQAGSYDQGAAVPVQSTAAAAAGTTAQATGAPVTGAQWQG